MSTAYIGLGSNLGDREAFLACGRKAIFARLRVPGGTMLSSSIYETAPMYDLDQPPFLNQVVAIDTELAPEAVLRVLLAIEAQNGRERTRPNGPRTLDLDLLLVDRKIIQTPALTLPHPRLLERAFVLVPLLEIAPDLIHPLTGRPLQAALPGVQGQFIRKWKEADTACGPSATS